MIRFAQFVALVSLLIVSNAAVRAAAEELPDFWPEFRGPSANGHAPGATPAPQIWSEQQNIAWKTALPGKGWSSPVIVDDQIWLTTAVPAGEGQSLRALCVARGDGRMVRDIEVFREAAPPTLNAKNSFASPTPVLDGDRVFVHFGTMGTAALDRHEGRVLWTNRDLQLDHKEGPGSSPISYGELLIVHCDGMDVQYVAALEKSTGKLAWKTTRTGPMEDNVDFRKAYSTPLVVRVDGHEELISPAADNLYAYDPRDGRELWAVRYKGFSNVPRPVFAHGQLYIATGYMKPQLWSVRPGGQGDVSETHVAWKSTEQAPAIPSPIVVGDRLYMVSNNGVATCLDSAGGKLIWRQRLGGDFSASPILAGDKLYFFNEVGEAFVIQPGDEYQLVAKNQLDAGCMASPAALGGALYVRTETHLYRIEVRDKN